MNKLIVTGHLGGDPVIQYMADGTAVARFSVAVNQGKKTDGTEKPALWVGCSAWRKQAEVIAQYFKKGDKILVSGEIALEDYEGKTYLKMQVREFDFMSKREAVQTTDEKEEVPAAEPEKKDDMPF